MVWLGLFFPFLTDCWYPSRKPKCKNHSWPQRCPPLSPWVQAWEQLWVGCQQRSVGTGFSVPKVLHAGPGHSPAFCWQGSTSASRYLGDWCWCLGFRGACSYLRMSHLSLMTSPVGLGVSPPSADRKIFSIGPAGFMLQILSAGYSFYWPFFWPPCTGYREGEKAALGGWGSTAASAFLAFTTSPLVFQAQF